MLRRTLPILTLALLAGCHRAPSADHADKKSFRIQRTVRQTAPGHPYIPPSMASRTEEIQIADRLRRRLGGHPVALMPIDDVHFGRAGAMRRPDQSHRKDER